MTDIPSLEASHDETLSHRSIIFRGGGPARVGAALQPPVEANTVKAWSRTDSIPGAYWQALADARLATLEELAAAAEDKRRASVPDNSSQAPQ